MPMFKDPQVIIEGAFKPVSSLGKLKNIAGEDNIKILSFGKYVCPEDAEVFIFVNGGGTHFIYAKPHEPTA